MDDDTTRRKELAEFLVSKRKHLSPLGVGLAPGVRRRTPGLRREEVAQLAGISATWYTWLEQGREIRPSEQVLESIARALQLSTDERLYLFRLAAPYASAPIVDGPVGEAYKRALDMQKANPAYIMNWRWDLVAWNTASCLVFGDFDKIPPTERNIVSLMFTNPDIRKLVSPWETHARRVIAQFHADFAEYKCDAAFMELITELKYKSNEFRAWWGNQEVGSKSEVYKTIIHPQQGRLDLEQTAYRLEDARGSRLVLYMPINDRTDYKLQKLYGEAMSMENKRSQLFLPAMDMDEDVNADRRYRNGQH